MDFKQYLAEAERRYYFRIKTVVPLSDKEMTRIELALAKYQPFEISAPAKTILQKHPMDFKDLENAEVWIVDAVLGLPASPYILQQDIRQNLNIPEKYVVVRSENDPLELQGEDAIAIDELHAEAEKNGLRQAALLTDPNYAEFNEPDGGSAYGDRQIAGLLGYLEQIRKERSEERTDPPNPLFNWLDMPENDQGPSQDETDFNAHLPKAKVAKPKGRALSTTNTGNFADNREVSALKIDAKGKTVVVRARVKGMKGDKA